MTETIGLDIGSHSIKLVGLTMTSKGPFLTHVGIKEIPYGEQKENLGFISETIKALYREVGLKPGKVNLTISSADIHIRRIMIPSMPKAELKEAVRWEMKNHLPYPIESTQIDFHILEEFTDGGMKKMDLIAVSCPIYQIDRFLSIAEGAGLRPAHLSVGPFALWNALLTLGGFEKGEVVVLFDFGAEKTGIYLFKNDILHFSREFTPAGTDFTRAVMEGIESQEEPDLVYEEAEKIKKAMGISSKAFYEKNGGPSINLSKIPFLVRPVLERLSAEIGRSLDYYKSQLNIDRVDRFLLSGGGANLKSIDTYLSNELRLPVESFNPFKKIPFDAEKIDPELLDQIGPLCTTAVGVALPEQRQIELLPAKEPLWSKARVEKYLPRLSFLIICLFFIGMVWHMNGEIRRIQKERDEKIAQAKTLEMLQAKLTMLKEKEAKIKQDLSIFPPSMIFPVPFRELLGTVSHLTPENVTVTLLSTHSKAKSQKEEAQDHEGNELQIKGLAFGSDQRCLTAMAQIIEGIEKSSLLKNAKLISADEDKSYNQPGIGFEIVCDINLGHPPSSPLSEGKVGELEEEKD
jgi:type IV pilus assembly protein PilM